MKLVPKWNLSDNIKRMSFLQWLIWKNNECGLLKKIYDIILNLYLYQISFFDVF